MASFKEANQARLGLKMKLCVHEWYCSSRIMPDRDGYEVVVEVRRLDNQVRKVISPVIGNVSVRTEIAK
jgi:hypothetical protein